MCPTNAAVTEIGKAGKMSDIVERLQDVHCDREPFTAEHAKCICRLTNEAAKEIERLRAMLPTETEKTLPTWDELNGCAPSATGELSSEEFVRELRDNW